MLNTKKKRKVTVTKGWCEETANLASKSLKKVNRQPKISSKETKSIAILKKSHKIAVQQALETCTGS